MSFEFRESDLCQYWHDNCRRLILNLIRAAYHPDCIYLPSKFRIAVVASFSTSSEGKVAIGFILAHEFNMFTCGEAVHITTPTSKRWFSPTDVESAAEKEPTLSLLPKKFTSRGLPVVLAYALRSKFRLECGFSVVRSGRKLLKSVVFDLFLRTEIVFSVDPVNILCSRFCDPV